MYKKYQLRFGMNDEELCNIFADAEISMRLCEVLKENKEFIKKQFLSGKEFLTSLLNSEKSKPYILDDDFKLKFIKNIKLSILSSAIEIVFSSNSFDVKKNILELLNSNDIIYIFKERICITFLDFTNFCKKWDYDKELRNFFGIN